MLCVRVLGELEVEVDGASLALPAGPRARALLARLALQPGPHGRSELAGRLRPDVLERSARQSLRQDVWMLRRALGPGALVATRDRIALDREAVWIDRDEFRRRRARGDLEGALALCRGDLLAGLEDDWILTARDEHRAEVDALLAALADSAAEPRDAVVWARRRTALDPLSETAHCELLARLAAAGDRTAALAAHDAFARRLGEAHGVPPSSQTRALVGALRRGELAGAVAQRPPHVPATLVFDGPFAGRREALGTLEAAWRAACSGIPGAALVRGEPGIGKTRLCGQLAAAVGGDVLYGRCDEQENVPYQPFAEALTRYLDALDAGERERLLDPPLELAWLLGDAPPSSERFAAFEAVRAVLERAARSRPILLVLDDLHWADLPTLALLRHVLRLAHDCRLLVVATYREEGADSGRLDLLGRIRALTPVPLHGLSAGEVMDLVERRGLPAEIGDAVYARTAGHPLFVSELLTGVEAEPTGTALPTRVREAILRRVGRLGRDVRATLTLAALLGQEVELAALEATAGELAPLLSGLDGTDVLAAAEAATAAGLLVERPAGFGFAHALVAEALRESLSGARAARLHRALAPALERHYGGADARAPELAAHWLAAGEAERASQWYERAARAAGLGFEQAAEHYRRALATAGREERRLWLLLGLGEASLRAGDAAAGRAAFAEAGRLAEQAGDGAALARAALGHGGLGVRIAPADPRTVALLETALRREQAPATRARLLARLAVELYYEDRGRARELSGAALRAAEATGEANAVAAALNARRVALWDGEHLAERLHAATAMVEQAIEPEAALQGRNWRVLDLLELGRVEEAEREVEAYARDADALALPHWRWYVPLWRGTLAGLRGDFAAMERYNGEAARIGAHADDANAALHVVIQRDVHAIVRGAFDEIEIPQPPSAALAVTYKLPLVQRELGLGHLERARTLLAELAADDFAALPRDANAPASCALAAAVVALGEPDQAAALAARLEPAAGRLPVIARAAGCHFPVDYYLGILEAAAGRAATARARLERALAMAERIGARPAATAARFRLGALSGSRELVDRALVEARGLGLRWIVSDAALTRRPTPR